MKPTHKPLTDARLLAAGRELAQIGLSKVGNGYAFNLTSHEQVLDGSPSLRAYLESKGLLGKVSFVGMPYCPPESKGMLHVDGKCAEAINFPVLNCDDADYIWFDAKIIDSEFRRTRAGQSTDSGVAEYRRCDSSGAKEIARSACAQPIWFNTHIPHCGVNRSAKPRVVATLRFSCALDLNAL